MRNADRSTLDVTLRVGQSAVLFPRLRRGGHPQRVHHLRPGLRLGVEGIRFGLIIAMCAIGLSLIFGTTGLVNFAHGEMVTFGALVAFFFNVTVGWHLAVAAPPAILVAVLAGAGIDRALWRPLRERHGPHRHAGGQHRPQHPPALHLQLPVRRDPHLLAVHAAAVGHRDRPVSIVPAT